MAFGEILRNARVQKGLTPSDVAEGTRLLIQVVEGLENEDFRRIAAPIYGRGFIKLYAELLELDPEPLIADFMNLYSGARVPPVLTKKVLDPSDDSAIPAPVPVTRTVSDPAPRAPQPPVRPVAIKETLDAGAEDIAPDAGEWEQAGARALPEEPVLDASGSEPARVAEPEEAARDELDDLELFRPQSPRRKDASKPVTVQEEREEKPKRKFPVFQVGGRMEKDDAASGSHDEDTYARLFARVQALMAGIAKLKDEVASRLPEFQFLPQKQVWLVGGAGLVVVTVMIIGISTLFKMTGPNAQKDPAAARFERVLPPPPLYVD